MNADTRRPGWLQIGGIVLCFVALAVYQTWPAWTSPRPALVGGGDEPDWTGTAWTFWWTWFAIRNGMNPFSCDWDFFPIGLHPVAQYNVVDAMIGGPLMALVGPMRGYNAFAVLALASTGLAAVALARQAGARGPSAVLAGIALQCSGFLCYEVQAGRLSQALLVFWILGLSSLDRLFSGKGTWRTAIAAGVLVAMAHLAYWYYGLFLLFAASALALSWVRKLNREILARVGVAAGMSALIAGPFVIALAFDFQKLPGVARATESWIHYAGYDRNEFGLANAIHEGQGPLWLFHQTAAELIDRSLAPLVMLLGLGGLIFKPRGRIRWLAVAVFGYVLSMGPYLKSSSGQPLPYSLPYLFLYDHMPFFSRLWWPNRLAVLPLVAVTLLAALHVDLLARWVEARRPRLGAALPWVLTALVLWQSVARNDFLPMTASSPRNYDPTVYDKIDGPIITTPVLGSDSHVRHLLWLQIFHRQRTLTGLGEHITGHRPPGYEDYVAGNGLLRALAAISQGRSPEGAVSKADIDALIKDGFKWAVVDPAAYLQGWQPVYADAFGAVFRTVWGEPDMTGAAVSAWRVEPIDAPTQLPTLVPIQPERSRAGPKGRQGPPDEGAPRRGPLRKNKGSGGAPPPDNKGPPPKEAQGDAP